MKKTFPILPLLAPIFLLAATVSVPAGTQKNSERVNIETIRGLRLSGYNQDSAGGLQWSLEADSAEIDPATKGKGARSALWNLRNLRLSTMGKDGEVFAEMKSALGQFSPENRTAESDSDIHVNGGDFDVAGSGWSWTGKGHDNEIRIRRDVSVTIKRPKTNENIFAKSKSLKIVGTEKQTVLTLFGNVRVSVDDIYMTCETLEILVPERGSVAMEERGGGDFKSSVRSIVGRGNVEMFRGGVRTSGDFAEFLPRENLFFVRGNVHLSDLEGRVSVRGDEAKGEIEKQFVEVVATRPNAALPLAPVAVSVAMPSLIKRGEKISPAEKTVVSGKKMSVFSTDEKTEIVFTENVVASDENIRIDSDRLAVTMLPFSEKISDFETLSAGKNFKENVKNVVATGNVRAVRDAMTLTCERADILTQEEHITLTGAPKVVSEKENATLTGHRVEIFTDENGKDRIEVFSDDASENALPRSRVAVSFPPFSRLIENAKTAAVPAETPAEASVVGDRLVVLREENQSVFDMTGNVLLASDDLGGSCDRVVVFVDTSAQKTDRRAKFKPTQIEKIVAEGNIDLTQNGYRLTGGRALVTPNIQLREWVKADDTGADGESPFLVVVEPDAETGTRPRIYFPENATQSGLNFALPDNEKSDTGKFAGTQKNSRAENVENSSEPAKESYLESDAMDLVAGERRIRFFLRGNVLLATAGGAFATCDAAEGLLLPQNSDPKNSAEKTGKRFKPEKAICRGNVRLAQDGAEGTGSTLEIFPPKNRAILRGNAKFSGSDGVRIFPGDDRFVFDLANRRLLTGEDAGDADVPPEQVSRPRIVIPASRNRVFIVPKSVRKKD